MADDHGNGVGGNGKAKLDDLIDFLTFTSLPLALVWRADLLPPTPAPEEGRAR